MSVFCHHNANILHVTAFSDDYDIEGICGLRHARDSVLVDNEIGSFTVPCGACIEAGAFQGQGEQNMRKLVSLLGDICLVNLEDTEDTCCGQAIEPGHRPDGLRLDGALESVTCSGCLVAIMREDHAALAILLGRSSGQGRELVLSRFRDYASIDQWRDLAKRFPSVPEPKATTEPTRSVKLEPEEEDGDA